MDFDSVRPLGRGSRQLSGRSMNFIGLWETAFKFNLNKPYDVLIGSSCPSHLL